MSLCFNRKKSRIARYVRCVRNERLQWGKKMSEELSDAIRLAFGDEHFNLVDAIHRAFDSGGRSGEDSIVDVVEDVAVGVKRLADAITPNLAPGQDATGGSVGSLTEAVMGNTAGLMQIASAIQSLADAVESLKPTP